MKEININNFEFVPLENVGSLFTFYLPSASDFEMLKNAKAVALHVFQSGDLILEPFRQRLSAYWPDYRIISPRYSPAIGAAIYAARLGGLSLSIAVAA